MPPSPSHAPTPMWSASSSGQVTLSSIAEGLQVAQQQAAHLRALHAAVVTSNGNNSSNNNNSSGSSNGKHPLKSKNPLKTGPEQRSRPSTTSAGCPTRTTKDYPVFAPSYEDFLVQEKRSAFEDVRDCVEPQKTSSEYGLHSSIPPLDRFQEKRSAFEDARDCVEPQKTSSEYGLHSSIPPLDRFSIESSGCTKAPTDLATLRNPTDTTGESAARSMGFGPHHITSIHPLKGLSSHKAKETEVSDLVEKKHYHEFFADPGSRKKLSHIEVTDANISCDMCRPSVMNRDNTIVVPLTSSQDFADVPLKDRTGNNRFKAWFFRGKKKPHPIHKESLENGANPVDETPKGRNSIEFKLSQANQKRDAALMEVLELRLVMGEMGKKLEQLELYCRNLKHALDKANGREEDSGMSNGRELGYGMSRNVKPKPTTSEFFHAVTEARVAVKQFCRTLVQQIQETDIGATDKLSWILKSYNIKVAQRISRSVRYHLESLINQAFFQDFENVSFERNGTHDILDPRMRCHAFYQSYVWLCKIGWSEAVSKESSKYSEGFDRFCRQKMSVIEGVLEWDGRWPDDLAHAFFVGARSVWLVHLLAFAYEPAATIFRVGEGRFDRRYMEEVNAERLSKRQGGGGGREGSAMVRVMVMPGFTVQEEVVKCKVLCDTAGF